MPKFRPKLGAADRAAGGRGAAGAAALRTAVAPSPVVLRLISTADASRQIRTVARLRMRCEWM
jgi:hypothetical protein